MSSALLSSRLVTKPAVRLGRQTPVKGVRDLSVRAVDRPVWFPGNEPPAWLDGSLPGDYGFDPLGLGSDPETLRWMAASEVFHGRVAMMGAAGILIPGLLTKLGILNVPNWYEAGKVAIENSSIPFGALLVVEFFMAGWVEVKRWQDFLNPGSQADGGFLGITDQFKGTGDSSYPGGMFFDPFGFAKGSEEGVRELKVKEVKNGRLAMLAMLGFAAQYAATGKGPIDNYFDHLADPYHVNFCSNGVSLPFLG